MFRPTVAIIRFYPKLYAKKRKCLYNMCHHKHSLFLAYDFDKT